MHQADDRFRAKAQRMVRLLEVGRGNVGEWRPEEFRDILRHQLSAPVWLDVPWLERSAAADPQTPAEAEREASDIRSFDDLFHHRSPPVRLLCLAKDFAKSNWNHPRSTLPGEIAALLYYESILAAWLHAGVQISQLTADEMRAGFQWVIQQNWVDDRTRELFLEGLATLGSAPPAKAS